MGDRDGLFAKILREIPILDGLPDVRWFHFKSAIKELFFTVILATSPLWMGALAASLIGASTGSHDGIFTVFLSNLKSTIDTGSLIIYAAALNAPVIYLASLEVKGTSGTRIFPSRPWHILFTIVVQLVGCVYFVVGFLGNKVEPKFAFEFSVLLFPFVMVMLLIAFCYKNLLSDMQPSAEMEISEASFSNGYSRDRRS